MIVYGAELPASPGDDVDLEVGRVVDGSKRELVRIESEVLSPLAGRELQPRSEFRQFLNRQRPPNLHENATESVDREDAVGVDALHANMPFQ